MTAALQVQNLTKTYVRKPWLGTSVEKQVLCGINLTLEKGKVLGLVGNRAVGKARYAK